MNNFCTCGLCGGLVVDGHCVACHSVNPIEGSKYEIEIVCKICKKCISSNTVNYVYNSWDELVLVCDYCVEG
jgi:hypothetical protein